MTFRTKKNVAKYVFVYSLLAYALIKFVLFTLYVDAKSIAMAFQDIDEYGNATFAGLHNFKNFFAFLSESATDPTIKTAIKNSLINYAIGLITPPICLLTSFYIYKKKPLYRTYRFIVMIPQIVSSFVLCLVFFVFVEDAMPTIMESFFGAEQFPNLLGNAKYTHGTTVFFSCWAGICVTILLYTNAMQAIDTSTIESARLDGCNYFQELFYIVLPLILGTIAVGFITGVGGIFTASGPLLAFWEYNAPPETMNLGYYFTQQVMKNKDNPVGYPMLSAMGIVFTAISLPLTLLVKRLFDKFTPEV